LDAVPLAGAAMNIRVFALLAFGCSRSSPPSLDLYVQQDGGNDSNDCSSGKPCLTIHGALDRIPGRQLDRSTTIHVSPGIFDATNHDRIVGLTAVNGAYLRIVGEQRPFWLDADSGYQPIPDVEAPGISMRNNYGMGPCSSKPVDGGWRVECP
jgi:hypothetical protein